MHCMIGGSSGAEALFTPIWKKKKSTNTFNIFSHSIILYSDKHVYNYNNNDRNMKKCNIRPTFYFL